MNSASPRTAPTPHLARLDAARGLAVLMVFVFHFGGGVLGSRYDDYYRWDGPYRHFAGATILQRVVMYAWTLGWSGVPLFFVLSGFVIHLSTLQRGGLRMGEFYRRRFWRIYPPYAVALIVLFVIGVRDHVLSLTTKDTTQLLSHLALVHNFSNATFFGINGSFWSLAVEAQFYLLYPVLFLLRRQIGIGRAVAVLLGLGVLSRVVIGHWMVCFYPIDAWWASTPALWIDWALGAYAAERFYEGREPLGSRRTLLLAFAAFVGSSMCVQSNAYSFSLASVVAMLGIDRIVRRPEPSGITVRVLAPIGMISYSLYLWHQPLIEYAEKTWRDAPVVADSTSPMMLVLFFAVTLLVAATFSAGMYFLVEKPSARFARSGLWRLRGARHLPPARRSVELPA